MAFLTDRTLATGVTSNDLIHIVITGDTTQNPAGSSYKATMGQVLDLINPTTLTGGTYDPITGTITFYDDNGGSFNVTGLVTGYTNTSVTGFTYDDANTFTIIENDLTTHSSSINVVTGMTFNGFLKTSGSTTSGNYSFAFGNNLTSSGDYSFSQGLNNTSSGNYSHVEGRGSTSSGFYSHAEGKGTDSSGSDSHAEGANTISSGASSHAEGDGTESFGANSHSEGQDTLSYAKGSHAEGSGTTTYGQYSHSEGLGTITNGDYQHVQGQFNLTASTNSAFIIGNGTSNISRSNLVLAVSNQVDIYGNLLVTGSTTASTLTLSSLPTTDTGSTTYYLTRDVSSGLVKTKITSGTPNTGLFSQTGNSTAVSATTSELSVIDGGLGSLSVPSNGFSVGDSFRADFGGLLSAKNNDTLRIRVKSGAVVLGDSGAQTMSTATNDIWGLSLNFTIRNTGVAGVAEIVTIGVFHSTKQSNGNQIGFAFNTINNTTFDTTISNTLDVTAEWSSNSALNSIYSDIFVLNKIF